MKVNNIVLVDLFDHGIGYTRIEGNDEYTIVDSSGWISENRVFVRKTIVFKSSRAEGAFWVAKDRRRSPGAPKESQHNILGESEVLQVVRKEIDGYVWRFANVNNDAFEIYDGVLNLYAKEGTKNALDA